MAHIYVQCKRTLARNPYHQLHRGMLRPSVFASPKVCSDLLTCVSFSVVPCVIRTRASSFISPVFPAFGGIPGADQADRLKNRFGNRRAIGRIAIYHPQFLSTHISDTSNPAVPPVDARFHKHPLETRISDTAEHVKPSRSPSRRFIPQAPNSRRTSVASQHIKTSHSPSRRFHKLSYS